MKKKKVKCSFCPNELHLWDTSHPKGPKEDDSVKITDGGAVNWFYCGYASDFDGEALLLAICDECLKKADILDRKEYLFTRRKDD